MAHLNSISAQTPWYELFSRGARDWLRHNEKVREAVQRNLPDLVAGPDVITGTPDRTVQIPVHLLEHARFRLAESKSHPRAAAGQGKGKPGDVLRRMPPDEGDDGSGGSGEGEVGLLLEFKVDDIIDWLWEELQLPDLQPKRAAAIDDTELVREGWDRRGVRARLDRRRTVKEAVKRRAIQKTRAPESGQALPAFTNEDLRFRQIVMRRRPATNAVVIFALDVSASMTDAERRLAKSFFFFALQGLRRRYARVETRFIAHTTQAWEFSESEFFHVTGSGGTGASTAFRLARDMIENQYDAARYNGYLFYASDGENFTEDRPAAHDNLAALAAMLNFIGYVETVPGSSYPNETEIHSLCAEIEDTGAPIGACRLTRHEDVWQAIRKFFVRLQPA